MKRRNSLKSTLLMVAAVIAAFVIAFIVKSILPESVEKWSGIIFWGIVVVVGGIGAFLAGKGGKRK